MKNTIYIGIDIGGTNTVYGFISEEGHCLKNSSLSTNAYANAADFFSYLSNTILSDYRELQDAYTLSGIGIAAPSANPFKGTIESPANLKWGSINIVGLMKAHFDIPVYVINDADAAALGEKAFGLAKDLQNFIVITLGTGLGAGIFIDGSLFFGSNGLAGELGHVIAEEDGRKCNCGRRGCLETYASVSGIKRTVLHLLSNSNENSKLRGISFNDLDGEIIYKLARENDPIALQTFEYTGNILGRALADAAACFAPEAIILSGGLTNAGDILLKPTLISFEKNLLSLHKGKVKLLMSNSRNGISAVLGAGSLFMLNDINKIFSKELSL